jgi:hypothetical protein
VTDNIVTDNIMMRGVSGLPVSRLSATVAIDQNVAVTPITVAAIRIIAVIPSAPGLARNSQ